jgi:hypothetical protein
MYIYIYVYIYMYIYVYVHLYICVYIFMYLHTYYMLRVLTIEGSLPAVRRYAYIYVCLYNIHIYMYIYVYIFISIYIHLIYISITCRAHFHVQELFTNPSQLMSGGQGAFDGFQQQQMQFNNVQTGIYMLIPLLMPLAGLHFCVGLDFVTPLL